MSIYQLTTYVLFILRIWRTNAKFIRGSSLTNWADAKEFCDEEYEGLATITDAIELGEAQTECFNEGFSAMGCWIGLSAVINTEHSTIVEWQLHGPGIPGAAQDWLFHRGGVFAEGNKIYLIGANTGPDAWVFDLDTQMWTIDSSIVLNPTNDVSLNGQYGAVINGAYYFQSELHYEYIQKYIPGVSLDDSFAPATNDDTYNNERCYTANEDANILYQIDGLASKFKYLDVTAVSPSLTSGGSLDYTTSFAQCAYINGYVYVFGGDNQFKISKINVGVNNENFGTATWEVLTTTMPVSDISQGEAVVAGNGKIYIGGFGEPSDYRDKVLEFNPADETITEMPSFNVDRRQAAFIYIASRDQICAFTGYPDTLGNQVDSWECSNVISLGGACTWSWDDMTAIDFGFNNNNGTDPTTGEAPWYTDEPDGCGKSISTSNDFCGALGASGACEKLYDDVDCDDTNQLPLCYASPTSTTSPTSNTNNPTNSPTMDSVSDESELKTKKKINDMDSSDENEAAFYGYKHFDTQINAKNEGVRSEHITINVSRSTVLNIFAIICGLLFMIGFMTYCFCFKSVKDTNPIFTNDI